MQLRTTAITATLALAGAAITAQQPGPPPGPRPGAPGFHRAGMPIRGFGLGLHPREVVANAPYSATFTSASTSKLQDGTVITHTNTRTVARDSQGRLREEITLEPGRFRGKKDGNAAPQKRTEVVVFDPVAQTVTRWSDKGKEAHVLSLPGQGRPGFGPRAHGFGPGAPPPGPGQPGAGRGPREGGKNVTVTELGSKMMDGVSVTGQRITRTIPAGAFGNDKDLVSTHEIWFSPDLKIVVSETSSDPFRGTHTTTVANLSKAEPAATLFKAPEGYTVQPATPGRPGPGFGPGPRPRRGSPAGPQGEQAPPPPPPGPAGESL